MPRQKYQRSQRSLSDVKKVPRGGKAKEELQSLSIVGKESHDVLSPKGILLAKYLRVRGIKVDVPPSLNRQSVLVLLVEGCTSHLPGSGLLSDRFKNASDSVRQDFRRFARSFSTFLFGTQEPELKLNFESTAMTFNGGVTVDNFNVGWFRLDSTMQNNLSVIFDEQQTIRGKVVWVVTFNDATQTEIYPSVAVIDYDDVTALTSFDQGLVYDVKVLFPPAVIDHVQPRISLKWHSQGYPDLSWVDTKNFSAAVCYLKVYGSGTYTNGASSTYAIMTGYGFFRFRQIVQG